MACISIDIFDWRRIESTILHDAKPILKQKPQPDAAASITADWTLAVLSPHCLLSSPAHGSGRLKSTQNVFESSVAMPESKTLTRIRAKALGTWDNFRHDTSALYAPLDSGGGQIRLVTLMSGNFEDEIICRLTTVFTEEKPSYEALSYVWGSTNSMRKIYINGRSMSVTENLYSALKHLRSLTDSRVLWIDAICINQIDVQERSSQVRHMGAIFRNASEVIAWLGGAYDDSDLAIDAFETFYGDNQLHWDIGEGFKSSSTTITRTHTKAMYSIFERSWWHRVWTVQESVLARSLTFVCGHRKMPAETLFTVNKNYFAHLLTCCFRFSMEHFAAPMDILARIRQDREDISNGWPRVSLLENTIRYGNRLSTDPRDKIYGLLGLAVDQDIKLVLPAYFTPVVAVYENFALSHMQSSRKLRIFSRICPQALETQGPRTAGLPSWVPDFASNIDLDQSYVMQVYQVRLVHFDATRGSRTFIHCLAPGKIILRGIILDTITTSSKHIGFNLTSYAKEFSGWKDMVGVGEHLDRPYPPVSSTTYNEAYQQTICASFLPIGNNYVGTSNFDKLKRTTENSLHMKWHKVWWDWLKIYGGLDEKLDSVSPDFSGPDISLMHVGITQTTAMRKLFLAENTGFLGLAPMSAEVGDKIVLLEGGRVPYILRPKAGAEPGYHEILGDAYVHGIMDGEAWKTDQLQEITLV